MTYFLSKLRCPKCGSDSYNKKGWIKNKREKQPIRQYQCKTCKARFSINSIKTTKGQKKPELNKQIMTLYCEGNTLRGMARILKVDYRTIVRKWRFMAEQARLRHTKALNEKEIVTTYIQFDEMETFEHTKRKPLGIELSIRPKTGQILSAKVCRIHIKGLAIAKPLISAYNKRTDRKEVFKQMIFETAKAFKDGKAVMSCDGDVTTVSLANMMCPESMVKTHIGNYEAMWRLNHTCAKLRHHISRLTRKTWATTKNRKYLQMHLDLFIAYQNGYDI